MEKTTALVRSMTYSLIVVRLYQFLGILFGIFAVLSAVPSLVFAYYGFLGKAIFLIGYALLNALFSYGLWNCKRWLVTLSLINAFGIVLVKSLGLWQHSTTGRNFFASIFFAVLFAGFVYATRSSLSGKRTLGIVMLPVYLVVIVPILLRSIGIL